MVQPIISDNSRIISSIIWIVFLVVVLFFAVTRIDKYIKIKAVDDCGRVSTYKRNIPTENAQATYPVVAVYKTCLKDKGY